MRKKGGKSVSTELSESHSRVELDSENVGKRNCPGPMNCKLRLEPL